MRESIRRKLWAWVQYLVIGCLANLGALLWYINRNSPGPGVDFSWLAVVRQWSSSYFAAWLVLFTLLSLIQVLILFFSAVRGRDRELSISKRSW